VLDFKSLQSLTVIPVAVEFVHFFLLEKVRLGHLLAPERSKRLHGFSRCKVTVFIFDKSLVVDGPGESPNVLFVASLVDQRCLLIWRVRV